MKVTKAEGHLRGKQPQLNRRREARLASLIHRGEYSTAEVAELFGAGRSTIYRRTHPRPTPRPSTPIF